MLAYQDDGRLRVRFPALYGTFPSYKYFSPCISVKLMNRCLKFLTGAAPFDGRHRRIETTIVEIGFYGHRRLPQPDGISDGLWKIIRDCWEYEPSNRPQMECVVGALIALHS